MKDSPENDETEIEEKSLNVDMLMFAFDFDSDATLTERRANATNSCEGSALCFIANQVICFATSFFNPLPKLERRNIGRHLFGLDRSRFVFGSRTTLATLKGVRMYSKLENA